MGDIFPSQNALWKVMAHFNEHEEPKTEDHHHAINIRLAVHYSTDHQ